MIPTARVERPPFHRGGSASTGIVLTFPLLLHDVHHQTGQRLREKIRRLMRHAFSRGRDGLHFADLGGIEKQGSRSNPPCHPVQRLMIVFGVENRFLILLRSAECGDHQLLEE